MRATDAFLLGGVLLVAFGLFGFLYSAINPDGGDSVRGIILFVTPLFPAMMGLVLIATGFAMGLMARSGCGEAQLA